MSPRERATVDVFRMYRQARAHQSVPLVAMRTVVETLDLLLRVAGNAAWETDCDYRECAAIAREYLNGMWGRPRYWLQAHYPDRRQIIWSEPNFPIRTTGTGWPL